MIRKQTGSLQRRSILVAVAMAVVALPQVAATAAPEPRSWDFSVLLDGDRIGYHRFELTDAGEESRLVSEARFDVRILFFNAFRYRHENTEIWSDGCLQRIDARTKSNGKKLAVTGSQVESNFIIDNGEATTAFPECVMTFAYWNRDFLQQPRLLDPQSGEYLDVDVEQVGYEPIVVRGREVPASVYQLTAKKLQLKLWYSEDDEWLALESIAKGGRTIRYELT